ncbi:serine/arginine repetitive matrix protein 1, partial [Leptidea sinapis]|uniref:serine/arginine repetitive matrix protein 1 n=1 Tax=Leptidea sinapis TaxID=189913 RepID=UPI0021C3A05A
IRTTLWAALCADYSVPVDCVAAGPAPRPSSFHEISAPKVEFLEAYCTPRDTAKRSPQRSRRSREPRRSPDPSKWRYDSRRQNYDFERRPYDYEPKKYFGREYDVDSGKRTFETEAAWRRSDYESARRTDFDLSAPESRRSPESAPEGSAESPPEPAPSAPLRQERFSSHRSQPYYESESSSDDRSSTSEEEEEEDEFGEFDPFATAPSLHSPDSGRSDPRYANAPRRNPSPYYYGDLFKSAPPPPAPSAPTASTTSSRGPRYRKSASLDAPHVAQKPNLPKRFSVAEDGFRELERSSSSSGESAWMPPRRRGRDAAGCACAAPEDVDELRESRSVFYVPAPLPRWPQEMSTRQIYETAFDCKIARSDDDLDDFDRVSNHPALLQTEERNVITSATSAFEAVERSEPDFKGRRKVTMKTDSVRRSKIPTIQQKRQNENVTVLSEALEKVHIEEEDSTASSSQLPLRGYTPSPPSTAPLPTKFQQKDGSAMNSIKSAPNLPQSQPAHPRLKDLRLPVKSLRARETPTSSDVSMTDVKASVSTELDVGQRLRDSSRESRDGDDERAQSKDGIFLEIKGRPTSDSDTPELNRYTGPKGVGPIMEFKGRPSIARPRRKYSSTESMATSSSGGSMESLRSSNSEGDRSSSSSESRRSSSLSSHSSDSGNVPFTKSHHMQLTGFGHHTNKLHILSPISDKSSQEPGSETSDNNKNNNSQKVSPEDNETANTMLQTTVEIVSKPKRRALQNRNLLNLTFRHSTPGDTEIQGSDSGISIHSREGVDSRNAFISFKSNAEEKHKEDVDLSDLPFDMPKLRRRRAEAEVDLRTLPFDMPKLRRKLRGQSLQLSNDFGEAISNTASSQSVQNLNQDMHREKLSLNFSSGNNSSSKGLHLNLGPIAPPRDLIDASLPLDRQGWYHGTLSRVEAESLLRDADEGAFLVRNSESAKHDYSLSLKSTRGFMHMRICRGGDGYTLGGASTAFPSVPALMRHYVTAQRLPVRGAEHMALSTPLPAVML